MMTRETLIEKIQTRTAKRDEFIEQVNRQIAFMNGQIELLEEMLGEIDGSEKIGADEPKPE